MQTPAEKVAIGLVIRNYVTNYVQEGVCIEDQLIWEVDGIVDVNPCYKYIMVPAF